MLDLLKIMLDRAKICYSIFPYVIPCEVHVKIGKHAFLYILVLPKDKNKCLQFFRKHILAKFKMASKMASQTKNLHNFGSNEYKFKKLRSILM